ncbi:MAG: hypothetical protein JOZ03_00890 [Gammaproteobacteria bacterium]|nr:hypothetical protein [Gammaproteobacteria bacterium]
MRTPGGNSREPNSPARRRRGAGAAHLRIWPRRCSHRRWVEISLLDLFIDWNEAPQAARTRSCLVPRLACCSNRLQPRLPRGALSAAP